MKRRVVRLTKTFLLTFLILILFFFSLQPHQIKGKEESVKPEGKIAFVRDGDIWVMNADGSEQRRITDKDTSELQKFIKEGTLCSLNWDQKGEGIYFMGAAEGFEEIWFVSESSREKKIWCDEDDGTNYYYTFRQKGNKLIIFNEKGEIFEAIRDSESLKLKKMMKLLFPVEGEGIGLFQIAWSPDDSKMLFSIDNVETSVNYLANSDGSSPRQLSINVGAKFLRWSPDSKYFLAVTKNKSYFRGSEQILLFDKEGEFKKVIFRSAEFEKIGTVDWSPDGKYIVFSLHKIYTDNNGEIEFHHEIWLINSDGSNPRKLTDNASNPAWQPIIATNIYKKVLIISDKKKLQEIIGSEGFDELNSLLEEKGDVYYLDGKSPEEIDGIIEGLCKEKDYKYILIIGNHDVINFFRLENPTTDGDILYSDDPYGDLDHDHLHVPDIPVARIPVNELETIKRLLHNDTLTEKRGFMYSAEYFAPQARPVVDIIGAHNFFFLSPPHSSEAPLIISLTNFGYLSFFLHGSNKNTMVWQGDREITLLKIWKFQIKFHTEPVAFTIDQANTKGIVQSFACYGAYTIGRTSEDSIALRFLKNGAYCFVGSTGKNYAEPDSKFMSIFWTKIKEGKKPVDAFFEAKKEYEKIASEPYQRKMLNEFVYFGGLN